MIVNYSEEFLTKLKMRNMIDDFAVKKITNKTDTDLPVY